MKTKATKQDDPKQSKRFIKAAKEAGAEETEQGAARAFKKLQVLKKEPKLVPQK